MAVLMAVWDWLADLRVAPRYTVRPRLNLFRYHYLLSSLVFPSIAVLSPSNYGMASMYCRQVSLIEVYVEYVGKHLVDVITAPGDLP